jgi:glycosyltransferase involved in cell wall biosynthesis
MHSCHIIASAGAGGMENHLIALCNGLCRNQTVTVVAADWFLDKFHPDVRVIPFNALLSSRYNPLTLMRLRRLIGRIAPDIIHAHGSKAATLIAVPRLFDAFIRVTTVHGLKRRTSFLRAFDRVIAVSQTVANALAGLPVDVVMNGVPLSGPPPDPGPENHPPLVIAIGRLVPVKGFDVLLRAWAEVPSARLLIVGDGPERAALEALSRQLGVSPRVTFAGFRSDVQSLLRTADLMVIASRREGLPLVLIEALHARRPVVSTAVGGMLGFLPPETLVPSDNPAALAATLNTALADLPAYGRSFETLWTFARRELTDDAMVARTEAVYRSVLAIEPTGRNSIALAHRSPAGQQQDRDGAEEQAQYHFDQHQIAAAPVQKSVDLHAAMKTEEDHGKGGDEKQIVQDEKQPDVESGGVVLDQIHQDRKVALSGADALENSDGRADKKAADNGPPEAESATHDRMDARLNACGDLERDIIRATRFFKAEGIPE